MDICFKALPNFDSLDSINIRKIQMSGKGLKVISRLSALLVWSDGTHNVRSPINVKVQCHGTFISINNTKNYCTYENYELSRKF